MVPELLRLSRNRPDWSALSLPQWDGLLRVARASNLLGRLAAACEGAEVPPPVAPHLLAARRLAQHQREAIGWECAYLARALAELGLPLVLLKGAAYALADQPAARGRLFGDVDLLVPRDALPQVEACLSLHGWSSQGSDAYDQRYYRQWMHELPPLSHVGRGTVLDVHHNILPLSSRRVPDASLLLAASEPIEGTPLRRLCLLDQLLHSACHLYHEGELRQGLRDLYDLDALIAESLQRHGDDLWSQLQARAVQLQLQLPLRLALAHTRQLLGTPVPQAALDAADAGCQLPRWRLALLDAAYLRLLRPALPESRGPADALAAAWLYLRSHALRMPPGLLLLHLGRKAMLRLVKHRSQGD